MQYKVKNLVLVNPYNTSRMCNSCGYVHKDLKITDRNFRCKGCGVMIDRDRNASYNILLLGQAIEYGVCSIRDTIEQAFSKREEICKLSSKSYDDTRIKMPGTGQNCLRKQTIES